MSAPWEAEREWMSIEEARKLIPEEVVEAALLEADQAVYGVSFEKNGKRVDPREVSSWDA